MADKKMEQDIITEVFNETNRRMRFALDCVDDAKVGVRKAWERLKECHVVHHKAKQEYLTTTLDLSHLAREEELARMDLIGAMSQLRDAEDFLSEVRAEVGWITEKLQELQSDS